MRFSSLVNRIGGEAVDAWRIHSTALAAAERGEDVIVLSVGDPDFATPEPIVQAAIAALQAGDTHYTTVVGREALRQAIANQQSLRNGQAVSASQVIVTAGTQNALYCATQCLCEAGDEVIVPEPMYLTYQATIGACGATLVPVPVDVTQNFQIDVAALAAAITPRTQAIYIATPCNPTGTVMDLATLQAIAQLAIGHDLWVVSDEVYADLTFEPAHTCIAALPGMAERTVTVSSLSKSYAMAGWRLGWAIGPDPLMQHMGNLQLCSLYGLPGFVQQGAIEAFARHAEVTQAMRQAYRERRDLAYALLGQVPGLQCHLPQAGMFMMIDIRQTGLSTEAFCWGLYHQTGVSVLDAAAFGPAVSGFVRLGFVVNPERLADACQRIASFVASVRTQGLALSVQDIQALHAGNAHALA
jgi:arginine:pyruvate transaminase